MHCLDILKKKKSFVPETRDIRTKCVKSTIHVHIFTNKSFAVPGARLATAAIRS